MLHLSVFLFSVFLPNVSLLRPADVRGVHTENVMSLPQQAFSTSAIFALHEEVEVQCVRWSELQIQFMVSVSAENRGGAGPAHLFVRRNCSVLQRQTQQYRQSGVVEGPQIQS